MVTQKNHIIILLFFTYIFKVYGALALNKHNIISDETWCYIHHVGNSILFYGFLYLIKDKIGDFFYSLWLSILSSRLITQMVYNGEEYWYEAISVIGIHIFVYSLLKIKKVWMKNKI